MLQSLRSCDLSTAAWQRGLDTDKCPCCLVCRLQNMICLVLRVSNDLLFRIIQLIGFRFSLKHSSHLNSLAVFQECFLESLPAGRLTSPARPVMVFLFAVTHEYGLQNSDGDSRSFHLVKSLFLPQPWEMEEGHRREKNNFGSRRCLALYCEDSVWKSVYKQVWQWELFVRLILYFCWKCWTLLIEGEEQ